MGNWSRDEQFFLAYFHHSLTKSAYKWYMRLDKDILKSWGTVVEAFLKQYGHNTHNEMTREGVLAFRRKSGETFREYASRWREAAMEVHPPLTLRENCKYFIKTLQGAAFKPLAVFPFKDFSELIKVGEEVDLEISENQGSARKTQVFYGGKKKEETVHYVQGPQNSSPGFSAEVSPSEATARPKENGQWKNKDIRPLPNFGITKSEFFKQLCEEGIMCPKPGRLYTPPYPPGLRTDLICEYHQGALGHDIEHCEGFRHHVLSLIDAKWLKMDHLTNAPFINHNKGKGVAMAEGTEETLVAATGSEAEISELGENFIWNSGTDEAVDNWEMEEIPAVHSTK